MNARMWESRALPAMEDRVHHARVTFIVLVCSSLLALGSMGCGDGTDTDDGPQNEDRLARDDATAVALRAVAIATNEALSAGESVPAPGNSLSAGTEGDGGDEGAATGERYVLRGGASEPEAVLAAEEGRIGRPVAAWFYRPGCNRCPEIERDLDELAAEYGDEVGFVRVDIDDAAAAELVRRFNIQRASTLVLYDKDGRTAGNVGGWPAQADIRAFLDQLR